MRVLPHITDPPPAVWSDAELAAWVTQEESPCQPYELVFSKYNPTPGTGRTGVTPTPPNNYPFYSEAERYVPAMQTDGGQLSEWTAAYAPSREQADQDRAAAYAAGVPHGFVAAGLAVSGASRGEGEGEGLELWVTSELHSAEEYGEEVDPSSGGHRGGPFKINVPRSCRIEALRTMIRDKGGVLPALQRLSYAGKKLDDSQRTLEHYGVAYWHARFPHWPLVIRRY